MKRSEPLRRSPMRARRRRPNMTPALRHAVWVRDAGLCQYCAGRVGEDEAEVHHRLLRSRGGQDSAENLITLHPVCHQGIHANPAKATEHGFMCPRTEDPADWPVHRFLSTWAQPTANGWVLPGGEPRGGDAA